jgi:hypothetical protein
MPATNAVAAFRLRPWLRGGLLHCTAIGAPRRKILGENRNFMRRSKMCIYIYHITLYNII